MGRPYGEAMQLAKCLGYTHMIHCVSFPHCSMLLGLLEQQWWKKKNRFEINVFKDCGGRRKRQDSRATVAVLHLLLHLEHFDGCFALHETAALLKWCEVHPRVRYILVSSSIFSLSWPFHWQLRAKASSTKSTRDLCLSYFRFNIQFIGVSILDRDFCVVFQRGQGDESMN